MSAAFHGPTRASSALRSAALSRQLKAAKKDLIDLEQVIAQGD